MDTRPTLEVIHLHSPKTLLKARSRALKHSIKRDRNASDVVSKYRRKQKRLIGATNADPDPYDSDYIFYCLEGERET